METKQTNQKFIGLRPDIYEALSALAELHKRPRGSEIDYLIGFYRSQMGEYERLALEELTKKPVPA